MQAITTKFFGPTNSRSACVIAKAQAGKLTHSWDYSLGVTENHAAAARALAAKLNWSGAWYAGGLPDGTGDVFVCVGHMDPAFSILADGEA